MSGFSAANQVRLIEAWTATGAETEKTFSNIPQTFRHLLIQAVVRSQRAAQLQSAMLIQPNADTTAANYIGTRFQGVNNAVTCNHMSGNAGFWHDIPAATALANCASDIQFVIRNYAKTTFFKRGEGSNGYTTSNAAAGVQLYEHAYEWLSTAAITSLRFVDNNTAAFLAGSTIELYGIL